MRVIAISLIFITFSTVAGDVSTNLHNYSGAELFNNAIYHFNDVEGYPNSFILACDYFKKSSEQGYPESFNYTANCYSHGFLGEKNHINYVEAEHFWQLSIDSLNDNKSKIELAKYFLHIPSRVDKYALAINLLNDADDIDGQIEFLLCDAELTGKGVPQNIEKGMKCLNKLAYVDKYGGSRIAQGALYNIFTKGYFNQSVDEVKANEWLDTYRANPNMPTFDITDLLEYLQNRCLFIPNNMCIHWE